MYMAFLRQRLSRGQVPEFGFEFFDKFTQHVLGPITLQNGEIVTQGSSRGELCSGRSCFLVLSREAILISDTLLCSVIIH